MIALLCGVLGIFHLLAMTLVFAIVLIVVGLLLLGYSNRSRYGAGRGL